MPLQTTYPAVFNLGFEGQLADGGGDRFSEVLVEENAADYFFGRAVERGAADNEFIIPVTGTLATFYGITHHTHAVELGTLPTATNEGIPGTKPANIVRKGRAIVFPEVAVTKGAPVFYRFQNAGADPEGQGRFRDDNDGASGDVVDISTIARWVTSAGAGAPAILEINLP
jgi:hypothetical protein